MSLAVDYRSKTFEDGFVGQKTTVTILKNLLKNRTFKNIMLFAGSSGCGKTTAARIFAKEINHGIGEPIEIDAASNNGVDQVRAIVESAEQRDLVGEYKVFIIDECHMITTQGWNAFLKCIEECPKYTIFIFCTTDAQKIPQTVLNRMQRFNFAPIEAKDIYSKLIYICQQEGFVNYDQSCDYISRISKGCMREAITNLERCADYSKDLSLDNVKIVLGNSSYETMFKLTWALQNKEEEKILTIFDEMYNEGYDLKTFVSLYLDFVIDLSKYVIFKNINVTNIPKYLATEDNAVVQFTTEKENSLDYFNNLADCVFNIKSAIKYDSDLKSTIVVLLLRFIRG